MTVCLQNKSFVTMVKTIEDFFFFKIQNCHCFLEWQFCLFFSNHEIVFWWPVVHVHNCKYHIFIKSIFKSPFLVYMKESRSLFCTFVNKQLIFPELFWQPVSHLYLLRCWEINQSFRLYHTPVGNMMTLSKCTY